MSEEAMDEDLVREGGALGESSSTGSGSGHVEGGLRRKFKMKNQKKTFDISLPAQHLVRL